MFSRALSFLATATAVISLGGLSAAQGDGMYYVRAGYNTSLYVQANEFESPLTLVDQGDLARWNISVSGGDATFRDTMQGGYAWTNGIPGEFVELNEVATSWHLEKVQGSEDYYKIHIDSKGRVEIYWTVKDGYDVSQERLIEDAEDLTQTWQLVPVDN